MKKKLLFLCVPILLSLAGCGNKGGSSFSSKGSLSVDTSLSSSAYSELGDSSSNTELSSSEASSTITSSEETSSEDEGEAVVPDKIIIHYQNEESFDGFRFWIWGSDRNGEEYEPNGVDDYGVFISFNPREMLGEANVQKGVYFLIKAKESWSYQTPDYYLQYNIYKSKLINGEYVLEVWALNTGSGKNLTIYQSLEETQRAKVKFANLETDLKTIHIESDGHIQKVYLYILPPMYFKLQTMMGYVALHPYLAKEVEFDATKTAVDITLDEPFVLNSNYKVGVEFKEDASYKSYYSVALNKIFSTNVFDNYNYEGDDLGVTFNKDGNKIKSYTFKLWAPTTYLVTAKFYRYGNDSSSEPDTLTDEEKAKYDTPFAERFMQIDDKGLYSLTVDNLDLEGCYYTYDLVNANGEYETIDPYAKSAGLDGKRGLIVDFDSEELVDAEFNKIPAVWDGVDGYDIETTQDLCISENHIRDLTMDDTWSSNPEDDALRGTYAGFIKSGTTYTKDGVTVKTGFDHLEELGVNAVQILPFFDSDNRESKELRKFNWGYDPLNYNCLDGSFSSNPKDGYERIKEFKKLVTAYANNKNHTRVIMDVVYNHVSSPQTNPLNITVPNYYFRLDNDGNFTDGSGCGNEVRTEGYMARKFIVNSLKFWASTYKIKGFRFDLMGLIDAETMKYAKQELYKIDPDIAIYGEGWGGGAELLEDHAITSSVYSKLYESQTSKGYVGAFNDNGRDALRGGNGWGEFAKPGYGFIAQSEGDLGRDKVTSIADMMKGIHNGKGGNPKQTINYASCHDNYTLFDQLNWTLSEDGGVTEPDIKTVARASVAVNASVILSNGVSFINGGEEIFRSKILTDNDKVGKFNETEMYGKRISHNSYASSDECNSYKYDRKVELLDYFNMYKDLIALRKELKIVEYPANCDKTDFINTWDTDTGTKVATYRIGKDGTPYYFFLNGRSKNTGIGSAEHKELVFNNSASAPSFASYVYTLPEKYQFVVYKG